MLPLGPTARLTVGCFPPDAVSPRLLQPRRGYAQPRDWCSWDRKRRVLTWTRLDGCVTSRDEQIMRTGLVMTAIERTPAAALASNFARPYNAHLPRTWAAP